MKLDLAELRRLHEAATPGPWEAFSGYNDEGVWAACGPQHEPERYDIDDNEPGGSLDLAAQADANLINATRNAIPALLAVVEAAVAWERHDTLENNAALRAALAPFKETSND